jgi:hypothetical protein
MAISFKTNTKIKRYKTDKFDALDDLKNELQIINIPKIKIIIPTNKLVR